MFLFVVFIRSFTTVFIKFSHFKCGACSSAHSSNVWGNRKSHWHSAVWYRYFEEGCRKQCRRQSQWCCGWFWIHCSSKQFERMTRKAMDVCLLVLKLSNKSRFDSYSVRIRDHIPYYLSGLSRAHFFRQPLFSFFHPQRNLGKWQLTSTAQTTNDLKPKGTRKSILRSPFFLCAFVGPPLTMLKLISRSIMNVLPVNRVYCSLPRLR